MDQVEQASALEAYAQALRNSNFALALQHLEAIPEAQRPAAIMNKDLIRSDRGLPLIEAAKFGASDLIAPLLALGASLESIDEDGYTALHWACHKKRWDTAQTLIAAGANDRAATKRGTRVADFAVSATAGFELAQRLYRDGVALDYANENGDTPLHFAASSGDVAVVQWVLAHSKLKPTLPNKNGQRPLDRCTTLAAFEALLSAANDAPACIKYINGDCTLHSVADNGEPELMRYLLERGAALGFSAKTTGRIKNTSLHYAAQSNRVANIEILLDAGAKINARNNYNYAPLHWAAESGHVDVIQCLINRKAELNPKTSSEFIIKEFRTPLYFAVDKGHYACAKVLLEAGADPNIVCDTSCGTPLTQACGMDSIEMIELLLAHHANPNGIERDGDDYFYFPLSSARSGAAVDRLVAAGADVNARGRYHSAALHSLVGQLDKNSRAPEIERVVAAVQALLAHGADVSSVDMHGQTALSVCKHPAITKLLVEATQKPAPAAPLSAMEATRQTKQNSYRSAISAMVSILTGKETPPTAEEAKRAKTTNKIAFGAELFSLANDIQDNATIQSLLTIAQQASRADVRYESPDSYYNNETILYRLIESLDHSDYRDEPIDWALALELTNVLIEKGADLDVVETLYGNTPLIRAVAVTTSGYTEDRDLDGAWRLVERLLDAGANTSIQDENGSCALDLADDVKIINKLMQCGCPRGRTYGALLNASQYDNTVSRIKILVEAYPAGINSQDSEGKTALMFAVLAGNGDVVKYLVDAGANIQQVEQSKMNVFAIAGREVARDGLIALLAANANRPAALATALNAGDDDGITCLGYLLSAEPNGDAGEIRKHREELALAFMRHGARIDVTDNEGDPMIKYAQTKKLQTQLEKFAKSLA
jgi:ankyrin repeat protein